MSPLVRWIAAIFVALALIAAIVGVGFFGVMAMGFGSAGCSAIGDSPSLFLLIASPALMILGVISGAVAFGLNKRWVWWVGSLAGGILLGVLGYVAWVALVTAVWCK